MKQLIRFTATAILLSTLAGPAAAQIEMPRTSQAASVSQRIGVTDVTIEYHRPGVKGRPIWGGLVPYDEVWRAGANERTTFSASDDVMVEGQPLPAGTYGLVTIPHAASWEIVFTKTADAWGAGTYDPSDDALRVEVTPREGPRTEWLEYRFEDLADDSATVLLCWDKVVVPFRVSVDLDSRVMENLRAVVRWEYPYQAATYALEHDRYLDDAMSWIEASLALERNFWNLATKARLLARADRYEEAIQQAREALRVAQEMEPPPAEGFRDTLTRDIETWRAEGGF